MDIAIEILQKKLIEAQGALLEIQATTNKSNEYLINIVTEIVDNSTILLVESLQHIDQESELAKQIAGYINSVRNIENDLNKINKIK
jgi:hypothetical protein